MIPRVPSWSLPFTVLADGETVYLVAGEDVRIAIEAGSGCAEVARALSSIDGTTEWAAISSGRDADDLVRQLVGERLLVEGPPEAAHAPVANVAVLRQDALDFGAVRRFNEQRRADAQPWLWVTSGPLARGYVSPLFLPDAGPCAVCVLLAFQKLSPEPRLYELLMQGDVRPSPMSKTGQALLAAVADSKLAMAARPQPSSALYQLHVVEDADAGVSLHTVLRDPDCSGCAGVRP